MTTYKTFTTATLGAFAMFAFSSIASADQQILDDLIVDGSICVGQDCVNGESFGFDTLRLKENNLRIKAQDTSTSASFPTNDWQLTFNDSANGGQNKFSVDDIDGGRTPFTIEAGARSNALYVDDAGRIGVGTATPATDLHVKTGNTPTLRLEQDGTSGFATQTWDVAGNEANFFVRDATNGSTLPLRIQPGVTSNLVYLASTDRVGINTTSPDDLLHVEGGNATIENTDGAQISFIDTGATAGPIFKLQNKAGTARLSFDGTGGPELKIYQSGVLELRSSCMIMNNGASTFACTFTAGAGAVCAAAGSTCP